jgi:2-methylcitrate dehydratase PrpD
MRRARDAYMQIENSGTNLTRRSLLRRAGWVVAAAALPGVTGRGTGYGLVMAAETISPVMAKLSTYMSEARNRALPDEVTEKAKHHVLDTFAAMISGSQLPPGRAAIRFASAYGGEKVATVVCSRVFCGPIEAALVNAVLAHSDETDDSHAPSGTHPGCSIVPATLATAEQFGIDGTQFLRAVALGYDIGPRVMMTLGVPDFQVQSHQSTHSIGGIFGSAAAAGCAASLNAQQMRWLLDYTAQQSAGIAAWQRDTDHIEKAFVFAGGPARSGVTAALLVQSGWTGVDDILSGADNFLLANAPKANPAGLVEKLGERYELVRTNIKKWTVGSPIQAPLDAMEILLKRRPFTPDQVQQVIVRVGIREASVVNNREMPDICLQHMVAVMLIDKTASFAAAHDKARMQDQAVLRQRAKVQLIPDEELERRMPRREAIVEVTLTDGTKLTEHVEAVRGTTDNPMPRDEVVAKSRDLMTPVLGAAAATSLIEKILGLENVKNIRELRPLLQRT